MTTPYDPTEIEPKWQAKWEADGLYHADIDHTRPKFYALTMLPYPSGNLHIGHWYPMTPSDARARFKRMNGFNVLFPMGFDAFGLPAENAAIKEGVHPMIRTYKNIDYMREQMRSMGTMFDWRREVTTSDPAYYKWSQWFFIQLFKRGLAYKKWGEVDWCPNCNTTLAREQVIGENRVCERCKTPVTKKELEQWYFRTTAYADELLSFEGLDWPDMIRDMQTNWIGRSEGASVQFPVVSDQYSVNSKKYSVTNGPVLNTEHSSLITVFTTRPDTLWGATFMVLAPEHPLVKTITTPEQRAAVEAYAAEATRQTEIEREKTDKEKTGIFTGGYAINPVNGAQIPIWIADYVLMTYGTGAIMAVPAHDGRDFAFARKYGLEIIPVIQPAGLELDGVAMTEAWPHEGVMINSAQFNGTRATSEKGLKNPAIRAVIAWLEEKGIGKHDIIYRLRDWTISRQRYWGSPIPIIYCPDHGQVAVPEDQLPITLPEDVEWLPTGQSPLKLHPSWKDTTCPICGRAAERDTDTLDTFMCSSWYHLRYLSPHKDDYPFDQAEYDYWMPVDTYTGGAEHATMHLIYTRFFHKAMRDMEITDGPEPMLQLRNQGQILADDGMRMSKSRGNVIDPDDVVRDYGADVMRAYLIFGYRWMIGGPWKTDNIQGIVRWLKRTWTLIDETGPQGGAHPQGSATPERTRVLRRKVHQTLKRVTHDYETFDFNTIISSLMELMNLMYELRATTAGSVAWDEAIDIYLRMLAPVCPHISEELWTEILGKPYSIHTQSWPQVDEATAQEDEITIPIQINGKVRDRITITAGTSEEAIQAAALATEGVQKALEGKPPRKVIVVPDKLVSIVL